MFVPSLCTPPGRVLLLPMPLPLLAFYESAPPVSGNPVKEPAETSWAPKTYEPEVTTIHYQRKFAPSSRDHSYQV